VFAAVERLASRAPNVDLRKLEGFEEEWAIRSGDWKIRLRFRHADHTIDVLQVLHRREAYRDR
jgi:mRNA-degrading endonuclease RelE of RelBE toxin-antitoxin system